MSRILMLLCLSLGLIMTGCGDETKDGDTKEQKTTKDDEKGSSEKGSGVKEGKKSGEKEDKKAEPAKKEGASVDSGAEWQFVKVELPNMVCENCEASVRDSLTESGLGKDLKTSVADLQATIAVKKGTNLESKLAEIAAKDEHVKDFKILQ